MEREGVAELVAGITEVLEGVLTGVLDVSGGPVHADCIMQSCLRTIRFFSKLNN